MQFFGQEIFIYLVSKSFFFLFCKIYAIQNCKKEKSSFSLFLAINVLKVLYAFV